VKQKVNKSSSIIWVRAKMVDEYSPAKGDVIGGARDLIKSKHVRIKSLSDRK
jgi:hypothetical protein